MPHTILILHRGGSQIRGSEEALLTLLDGLDRDAFRPVVVASDAVLRAPLEARGIACHVEPFPELMIARGELRLPVAGYLRALGRLTRLGRAEGAALVLCNGGGPCQLGVPLARRLGVPSVCLFHHPAPGAYHRWWLTRRVDTLICSSRFTEGHTRAVTGRGGEVVYIGIDVERFAPPAERDDVLRRELGYDADTVVFAQVGALVPHKEHDLLLAAFARASAELPEARLLVIGAGPEEARLRARTQALGLEPRVRFTGYVPDVTPYFTSVMDVNVLASREEGLGLVNVQASACAVPNVATDGTGIRETTVHERTGLLFPQGDAEALAAAMLRLGRDARLRAVLGAEGRRLAVERFSKAQFGARMQEAMRALLDARRPRGLQVLRESTADQGG